MKTATELKVEISHIKDYSLSEMDFFRTTMIVEVSRHFLDAGETEISQKVFNILSEDNLKAELKSAIETEKFELA